MHALPLLLILAAGDGVEPSAPRDLAPLIAPIREKAGLPALGGAIVTSQGLEAIGTIGVRSIDADAAVTNADRWHLGSCTKTMTATLVARLVERGDLSWETTIADALGEVAPEMDSAWSEVTITMLLCHRSGASRNFDEEIWSDLEARPGTPRELRRRFAREGLRRPPQFLPDTRTEYSNAGVMIAGAMIEEIEDAAWEDLIRREVFEPLGMTETGFGAPGTPGVGAKPDQPLGHTRGEQGWKSITLGPEADNPAVVGPAGTVHATLSDWARFARAHLAGERGDTSFLSAESWKRLHTLSEDAWSYTPGWQFTEPAWADGVVLRHLGSNTYWVSELTLVPQKDYAVLIVTNVGDDKAEKAFADLLEALVADHAAHAR